MAPAITAHVTHDPIRGTYHWRDGAAEGTTASLSEAKFYAVERWITRAVHFHLRTYTEEGRQDALQEGLIALWRVLSDPANPKHTTALDATPSWLIQRGVLYAKEYASRAARSRCVSLDQGGEVEDGRAAPLALIPAIPAIDTSPLELQTLTLLFVAVTDPRHRAVGAMLLGGYKPLEIARALGWHESGVSRALQKAIRPLLSAILTDTPTDKEARIRAQIAKLTLPASPWTAEAVRQVIVTAQEICRTERKRVTGSAEPKQGTKRKRGEPVPMTQLALALG